MKLWIEWKYHGGKKFIGEEYLKAGKITGSGNQQGMGHNKNNCKVRLRKNTKSINK